MAKLMSKKTKEIVQTTSVLLIVAAFAFFYIIYPLNTIDDFTARANPDDYSEDIFEINNDPAFFVELGMNPDTFSVTTIDNIQLAGLYFKPDTAAYDSVLGTVILVNPENSDRTYYADYIPGLLDSGLAVAIYDQRSSGQSGGVYYAGGVFEADDLIDVLATIDFRGWIDRPLNVVGIGTGADAGITASQNDERIDEVIAVNPYLTTTNWIETSRINDGTWGIPLSNMVYFWWYKKSSGFPYDRTSIDDIDEITKPTVLLIPEDRFESPEITKLKELSSEQLLTIVKTEIKPEILKEKVLSILFN